MDAGQLNSWDNLLEHLQGNVLSNELYQFRSGIVRHFTSAAITDETIIKDFHAHLAEFNTALMRLQGTVTTFGAWAHGVLADAELDTHT